MAQYNSTRQYEPITIPQDASPSERRAWQRLTEILDDIYLKYGRITVNDLAKTTVNVIAQKGVFETIKSKELQATLARFATAEIGTATISKAQIGTLNAQLINGLKADLEQANIEEAEVERLTTQSATIINAYMEDCVAGRIKANEMYAKIFEAVQGYVGDLAATNFTSSLANISYAQIANLAASTADIDYARIKDLDAEKAIIRKGESDELYIDQLAVSEANMVRLNAGEIVLKGTDGKYYQLTVNDAGSITTTEVIMDGSQLDDGSITGTKIIEHSITVDRLNVSEIFGSEAVISNILASIIKSTELHAKDGFIDTIKTSVINSENLKTLVDNQVSENLVKLEITPEELQLSIAAKVNDELKDIKTAVVVDESGLTLTQPNKTDSRLVLDAEGLAIVESDQRQLWVNEGESFMPNLRVSTFFIGNLKTSVMGEGEDLHIVEQYVG